MIVAAVTATTVLTTAAAAVVLGAELLGRGVAHHLHIAAVAHRLACQLVVEVHEHLVVGHLDHLTLDAHSLLGHHGHAGSWADVLLVKLALHMEDFLLQLIHQLGVLHAEGLVGLQGEVKFLALLQTHDVVLESLDERQIHAEYKGIGVLFIEFENTGLLLAAFSQFPYIFKEYHTLWKKQDAADGVKQL